MPTPSKLRNDRKSPTQHDWARYGEEIILRYLAGESPQELTQHFPIPVESIGAYIGRHGCRRDAKQAKAIAMAHGRASNKPKTSRECPICKEVFQPNGPNQQRCKQCIPNSRFKEYYGRYRVSKRDWDRILANQGGTCALCSEPAQCIDHGHVTGVVRGLLCVECNHALSRTEHPDWASRAKAYVFNDTGCPVNTSSGYWTAWRTYHTARDAKRARRPLRPGREL